MVEELLDYGNSVFKYTVNKMCHMEPFYLKMLTLNDFSGGHLQTAEKDRESQEACREN